MTPQEHAAGHRQARRQMDERCRVLDALVQAFENFTRYNRRSDAHLPPEKLLQLLRQRVVTKNEIVAEFRRLIDPDERQQLLDTVCEVYNDFVFHDRKFDDTLSWQELERLLEAGAVTRAELIAEFERLLDGLDTGP